VLTLYAFRSCGKAIPHVQSQHQENKHLVYERTCEVLKPEIYRMVGLMDFRDKLVSAFSESFTGIIADVKDKEVFPSETFLLTLAQLLDLTVSLDTMKNFKGSMANDLSMYKRSKSMITKDPSDPEMMLLPKLSFFLASKDQFANDIKKALSTMSNTYEEILIEMLNTCADHLEKGVYILPQLKHIYLRAMAFAIWLIDGEGDEMDFVKKKKFKVDRVAKLFRATPVVPLFGDIAMNIGSILVKSPHWNSSKYDILNMDPEYKLEMANSYLLLNYFQSIKKEYAILLGHLQQRKMQLSKNGNYLAAEDMKGIYNDIFGAVKFLSELTNSVLEQAAWKYLNPSESNQASEELTDIYERAVQFNYGPEEKKVLVMYISMIKDLQAMLLSMEPKVKKVIGLYINGVVQNFNKGPITEYYNSALKKKKPTVTVLKSVKDYIVEAEIEQKIGVALSDKLEPVSATQLYFIRSILDLSFNEKSKGMKGGLMKEKNFKETQVAELERFFNESYHYTRMMDLSNTIRECADLSNLWFKEFYLELTKQVQFPTKTSLPWILAEFVLDSTDSSLLQNVFIPLDLYNDAGYKTLNALKSRYIFDEIEAEVNLCFDQFMFKLGKNVFRHYKKLASIKNLEADIKIVLPPNKSFWNTDGLVPGAFENILKQKDVKILGRSVDLSKILSVMMSQYLKLSIDAAISRFESCDLTGILELETLLQISQKTHRMLSQFLHLEPFEDLLKEVDESVGIAENNGRIVTHVVHEIVQELIPNYCYNNVTARFLKSTVFYAEPVQRPNIPNAKPMYLYGTKNLSIEYTMKNGFFKDYIGEVHFQAALRIIGQAGLAVVGIEICNHVKLIVEHTLSKFLQIINDTTNFPISIPDGTTFVEVYDQFCFKYGDLSRHKALKGEILQAFREIGNSIMAMKSLEDCLILENATAKLLVQDIQSYGMAC
jgi:cytoplasmic FMR1 interacting protein